MVAGIALATRILWLVLVPVAPSSDGQWFYETASNLSQGLGYVHQDHPTALFPVGYPFLLSLGFSVFGPGVWVGQFFNLLALKMTISNVL